jgi:hypothetical protein
VKKQIAAYPARFIDANRLHQVWDIFNDSASITAPYGNITRFEEGEYLNCDDVWDRHGVSAAHYFSRSKLGRSLSETMCFRFISVGGK